MTQLYKIKCPHCKKYSRVYDIEALWHLRVYIKCLACAKEYKAEIKNIKPSPP